MHKQSPLVRATDQHVVPLSEASLSPRPAKGRAVLHAAVLLAGLLIPSTAKADKNQHYEKKPPKPVPEQSSGNEFPIDRFIIGALKEKERLLDSMGAFDSIPTARQVLDEIGRWEHASGKNLDYLRRKCIARLKIPDDKAAAEFLLELLQSHSENLALPILDSLFTAASRGAVLTPGGRAFLYAAGNPDYTPEQRDAFTREFLADRLSTQIFEVTSPYLNDPRFKVREKTRELLFCLDLTPEHVPYSEQLQNTFIRIAEESRVYTLSDQETQRISLDDIHYYEMLLADPNPTVRFNASYAVFRVADAGTEASGACKDLLASHLESEQIPNIVGIFAEGMAERWHDYRGFRIAFTRGADFRENCIPRAARYIEKNVVARGDESERVLLYLAADDWDKAGYEVSIDSKEYIYSLLNHADREVRSAAGNLVRSSFDIKPQSTEEEVSMLIATESFEELMRFHGTRGIIETLNQFFAGPDERTRSNAVFAVSRSAEVNPDVPADLATVSAWFQRYQFDIHDSRHVYGFVGVISTLREYYKSAEFRELFDAHFTGDRYGGLFVRGLVRGDISLPLFEKALTLYEEGKKLDGEEYSNLVALIETTFTLVNDPRFDAFTFEFSKPGHVIGERLSLPLMRETLKTYGSAIPVAEQDNRSSAFLCGLMGDEASLNQTFVEFESLPNQEQFNIMKACMLNAPYLRGIPAFEAFLIRQGASAHSRVQGYARLALLNLRGSVLAEDIAAYEDIHADPRHDFARHLSVRDDAESYRIAQTLMCVDPYSFNRLFLIRRVVANTSPETTDALWEQLRFELEKDFSKDFNIENVAFVLSTLVTRDAPGIEEFLFRQVESPERHLFLTRFSLETLVKVYGYSDGEKVLQLWEKKLPDQSRQGLLTFLEDFPISPGICAIARDVLTDYRYKNSKDPTYISFACRVAVQSGDSELQELTRSFIRDCLDTEYNWRLKLAAGEVAMRVGLTGVENELLEAFAAAPYASRLRLSCAVYERESRDRTVQFLAQEARRHDQHAQALFNLIREEYPNEAGAILLPALQDELTDISRHNILTTLAYCDHPAVPGLAFEMLQDFIDQEGSLQQNEFSQLYPASVGFIRLLRGTEDPRAIRLLQSVLEHHLGVNPVKYKTPVERLHQAALYAAFGSTSEELQKTVLEFAARTGNPDTDPILISTLASFGTAKACEVLFSVASGGWDTASAMEGFNAIARQGAPEGIQFLTERITAHSKEHPKTQGFITAALARVDSSELSRYVQSFLLRQTNPEVLITVFNGLRSAHNPVAQEIKRSALSRVGEEKYSNVQKAILLAALTLPEEEFNRLLSEQWSTIDTESGKVELIQALRDRNKGRLPPMLLAKALRDRSSRVRDQAFQEIGS